jgi:hypothetical protein
MSENFIPSRKVLVEWYLDKKSMHWLSWYKIARTKSSCGLGFWDLELFDLATLGKQRWRLLTQPQSICARVI